MMGASTTVPVPTFMRPRLQPLAQTGKRDLGKR
jgi:hypothetical protein